MAASDGMLSFEPRYCEPPGTVDRGFGCGAIAARCDGAAGATS
jgi:hypothetical protein